MANITLNDIKNEKDPAKKGEMLRLFAEQNARAVKRGAMELAMPIDDGEKKYEKLEYDFDKVTGMEYIEAMDAGSGTERNSFKITQAQALNLFCIAASKCQPGLFPNEIKERLSIADVMGAVNIGTLFFRASSQAGSYRISNA